MKNLTTISPSDRLWRLNAPQALIILGAAWVLAMVACLLWAVLHG